MSHLRSRPSGTLCEKTQGCDYSSRSAVNCTSGIAKVSFVPRKPYQLPSDFAEMTQFSLQKRDLYHISKNIGGGKSLLTLDLSDNNLSHLPRSIAKCKKLLDLNLSNNAFEKLSQGVFRLKELTNLNLSDNKFKSFPEEIKQLTSLRLLTLPGNPICHNEEEIEKLKAWLPDCYIILSDF